MTMLYLTFAPIFFLTFTKRIKHLAAAIKRKDCGQIKAEALFMGLTGAVSWLVLMSLQRLSASE